MNLGKKLAVAVAVAAALTLTAGCAGNDVSNPKPPQPPAGAGSRFAPSSAPLPVSKQFKASSALSQAADAVLAAIPTQDKVKRDVKGIQNQMRDIFRLDI